MQAFNRWWPREIEVPFPNWEQEWACIGFERPKKTAQKIAKPRPQVKESVLATPYRLFTEEG